MKRRRQAIVAATAQQNGGDEIAALKKQFRREDQELMRQGRGREIAERNRRLMGIKEGDRGRIIGWNGKILKG